MGFIRKQIKWKTCWCFECWYSGKCVYTTRQEIHNFRSFKIIKSFVIERKTNWTWGENRNPITFNNLTDRWTWFSSPGQGLKEDSGGRKQEPLQPLHPSLSSSFHLFLPPLVSLPGDWWLVLQLYSLQLFLWGSHWVRHRGLEAEWKWKPFLPQAQGLIIQHKNRKGCRSPDLAAGAHDHYEDRFDWRGSYSKCHQHRNITFADFVCIFPVCVSACISVWLCDLYFY